MSLLKSISARWAADSTLCAKIPFAKVFTGRVPQTQLYAFPYVSVLATGGAQTLRTDKTQYSHGPLSFHIWVDESKLEFGEETAELIANAFANRCWRIDDNAKVIDVLDEGEPLAIQTDLPTVKAWEVVKLLTVCIERTRVDPAECCVEI